MDIVFKNKLLAVAKVQRGRPPTEPVNQMKAIEILGGREVVGPSREHFFKWWGSLKKIGDGESACVPVDCWLAAVEVSALSGAVAYMKDIVGRRGYEDNASLMEPEQFRPYVSTQMDGGLTLSVSSENTQRLEWLYAEDEDGNIIDIKRIKEADGTAIDEEDDRRSLELTNLRLDAAVPKGMYITPYAVWFSERVVRGERVRNQTVLESELLDKFAWARKKMQKAAGKPPVVTGDPSLDAALHKVNNEGEEDAESDDGLEDL